MKQTLTLLAALLLGSFSPARADLVAHFRFDDDLKDVTGQHDGRPVDAKLAPAFAPGRVGSALVIEKVNAGIELANPSAIDFSRDFTIATWVNVGNYYAEMPVLFKGRADLTAAPDKFFGLFGMEGMQVLARPATIPRARAAETERKAISYHCSHTGQAESKARNSINVDHGPCVAT
jgi:hypothetical protein